ncbi:MULTISPECIES: Smr/MutS family protein [Methylosinus]|uniref:DNA mismatch repair protein MutS n=1 Tax=Methylosinus sporium TaxID=428 RepID=A0A2U1SVY5_METSR|nr:MULTISPECIES: Smr/MutS family protein [Methylosinus]PWB95795.1 DNA mismatch repair protein MutS [Methylosinus sporium]
MADPPRDSRRSRFLSKEEIELWNKVTADVRPTRARRRPPEEQPIDAPESKKGAAATPAVPVSPPAEKKQRPRPAPPPAEIDHRTRTKLRRGRLEVEAKLDLHGLRQAEAQTALYDFLRRAQAAGARMAIVVTGKGVRSEEGGVLRRLAPMWLSAPAMRDLVVGFGEAARNHGGEGALYVQIRRPRGMK